VVEKPFDVTTRTGRSTGRRSQRRVLVESVIVAHHYLCTRWMANYQSERSRLPVRDSKTWRSQGCQRRIGVAGVSQRGQQIPLWRFAPRRNEKGWGWG
jgi:hypothetical protein